jgi:hypothetical protein
MPTDDIVSLTIEQFCRRNQISGTTYHRLKREGKGPREMYIGWLVRVSLDAEREWQAARTNHDAADLAARVRYRARAKKAGRLAVLSPKHPRTGKKNRARAKGHAS